MFEITPEMQEDYKVLRNFPYYIDLPKVQRTCDALRDAVAQILFHQFYQAGPWSQPERINWTPEQWQAEAHKRLMGES